MKKYAVETYLDGSWQNCWVNDAGDGLKLFPTILAADDAIKEHIYACQAAVFKGHMPECPLPGDFRVAIIAEVP